MKCGQVLLALAVAFVATCMLPPANAAGVATLAIDYGSEWVKIGLVKPGVPMDIVLNRESKRKTANVVAIRNGERTFGADALTNAVKYPKLGFRLVSELLGQKYDSPVVETYKKLFPEHNLVAHPDRGTVVFKVSDEESYAVEELVAMMLQHAIELGEEFAEQPITGVVITVPAYFAQAERKAMRLAAELAGANVLQLINAHAATALNYGVFRRAEFDAKEQHFVFYDMGSFSTIATVVGFGVAKDKDSKSKAPQLQVKGIGFDRTLGGIQWDHRLQQYLLQEFKTKYAGKFDGDPGSSPRTMAKLLKEAQRVKTVLSANTETYAQIEGLYQDVDFRLQVTRDKLEELAADLYPRALGPIERALQMAEMSISDTKQLILFGGAVRMPRIKAMLLEANEGRELGQSINADEAAALGGAYQAAALSKAFRVKKFGVKDANLYPIQVHFDRVVEDAETGETKAKRVVKTVFDKLNVVPQKKVLTFNRFEDDFSFDINYGDISFLPENEQRMLGSLNISSVQVKGVADAFAQHKEAEAKGVKAHFRLTEDGIVTVDKIDANFEQEVDEEQEEDDKTTLEKLGDAFNNMFSGSEDKDAEKDETNEGDDASDTRNEETETPAQEERRDTERDSGSEDQDEDADASTDSNKGEEADGAAPDSADDNEQETSTGGGKDEQETDQASDTNENTEKPEQSDQPSNDTASESKEEAKPKEPPKPKTVKVVLDQTATERDVAGLTDEGRKAILDKLQAFKDAEEKKRREEAARNNLEASIFSTRDKLYDPDVESVTTEEEREGIQATLSELSEWLDDEGFDAGEKELLEKQSVLDKATKDMHFRVKEKLERPEAIKRLNQSLQMARTFVEMVNNYTANATDDTPTWISEKDLSALETLANETQEWFEKKQEEQDKLELTENPVLKTSALKAKNDKLDRELVYLMNRPKPKPKPKPKKKVTTSENDTNSTESATVDEAQQGDEPIEEAQEDQIDQPPTGEPADEETQDKSGDQNMAQEEEDAKKDEL